MKEEKEELKIQIVNTNSSKSSDSNTYLSDLSKKRLSAGNIKFNQKSFLSPNTKSRRSSQFFQSNNNSFVLPSNNDVSILGGEYSDVSMLYCNGTEKIHQDNSSRDNEAREFKNEYDITFNQKYNMNNNPNHRIVTKEITLPSGVKER